MLILSIIIPDPISSAAPTTAMSNIGMIAPVINAEQVAGSSGMVKKTMNTLPRLRFPQRHIFRKVLQPSNRWLYQ